MCGAYCLFAGTSCILVDRNLERRRNMDLEHLIEPKSNRVNTLVIEHFSIYLTR